MLTYYSILKFISNSHTGEFLSLGLVAVTHQHVYFQLSSNKLALAQALNRNEKGVYEQVQALKAFMPLDLNDLTRLLRFENKIDLDFLHQITMFTEGGLRFSRLDFAEVVMDEQIFQKYFEKLV